MLLLMIIDCDRAVPVGRLFQKLETLGKIKSMENFWTDKTSRSEVILTTERSRINLTTAIRDLKTSKGNGFWRLQAIYELTLVHPPNATLASIGANKLEGKSFSTTEIPLEEIFEPKDPHRILVVIPVTMQEEPLLMEKLIKDFSVYGAIEYVRIVSFVKERRKKAFIKFFETNSASRALAEQIYPIIIPSMLNVERENRKKPQTLHVLCNKKVDTEFYESHEDTCRIYRSLLKGYRGNQPA